jgi:hypothetical protein
MIAKNKPDIVITDIRMPGCDGLTLLKKISSGYPDIKNIVISGYDDFEYARAALKSGSLDYLLKPVDPGELNRAIERACRIIEQDKKIRLMESVDEPALLYKLLHGMGTEDTSQNLFPDAEFRGHYCAAVVFRDFGDGRLLQGIDRNIKNLEVFKKIVTVLDRQELSAVFFDPPDNGRVYLTKKVLHAIRNILAGTIVSPEDIIAGIGRAAEHGGILDSYNSARQALCHAVLKKGHRIFLYDETSALPFINIPVEQSAHTLEADIISGNPEGTKTILSDLFAAYFSIKDISLDSIHWLFQNFAILLSNLILIVPGQFKISLIKPVILKRFLNLSR